MMYVGTVLLCAGVVSVAMGASRDSILLFMIGGALLGAYNSVVWNA